MPHHVTNFARNPLLVLLAVMVCLSVVPDRAGAQDLETDIKRIKAPSKPPPSWQPGNVQPIEVKGSVKVPPFNARSRSTSDLFIQRVYRSFVFEDNISANGFVTIPPDPIGAAGKTALVAVVNSLIELRNKGGKLHWQVGLSDFFSPLAPHTAPFDPKIVYDHYEDRFVVVALEYGDVFFGDPANVSRFLLAVSKSGNPRSPTSSDWHFLAINVKETFVDPFFGFGGPFDYFGDYPGLELDEEAIYITNNLFSFVTDIPDIGPAQFYGGSRVWIVEKSAGSGGFYDGGPADYAGYDAYGETGLTGLEGTTMPALVHGEGGVGGPGSTLGTFLVQYSGLTLGGPGAPEALLVFTINDPLGQAGGPHFFPEFVVVGDIEDVGGAFGWPSLPDAPQKGTDVDIEVNDRRVLDAVWRDGSLWATTTILPNSGPDQGETTAHWFKLDTSTIPGIVLDDQGNIGGDDIAPGTFTYFPAVAVNREGDVGFGFSASAPSIYAGAYATARRAGDPPGSVLPSATIHPGQDFYIRTFGTSINRWGDYSGIAVDPTNEKVFWVYNQYAGEQGTPTKVGEDPPEFGRWETAWGSMLLQEGRRPFVRAFTAPPAFELAQNHPNPFNPSTVVAFSLPEESNVHLAVYDMLGRQVQVLSDGVLPAGEHEVTFHADRFPSGVYLLRMRSSQGILTRQMHLVK